MQCKKQWNGWQAVQVRKTGIWHAWQAGNVQVETIVADIELFKKTHFVPKSMQPNSVEATKWPLALQNIVYIKQKQDVANIVYIQ